MLREYASLSKDVVVIGVVNRLEIWDAARWQAYSDTHEESFSDLGEEVFPRRLTAGRTTAAPHQHDQQKKRIARRGLGPAP